MSRFRYFVAASVLHDAPAVERIFSRYQPLFSQARGERIYPERLAKDAVPESAHPDPLSIFILTGGTEGVVLEALGRIQPTIRARPVLLVAHPEHNSLPAALEILARLRQDGGRGTLVLLKGPEDRAGRDSLLRHIRIIAAADRVAALRIGAVGEPSEWLVASSQDARTVAASWGSTLVPVSIDDLRRKIEAVRASGEKPDKEARDFWADADSRTGPSEADLAKSYDIYRALRLLAEERTLDALTLRCFDLVTLDASTGCYALSRLADEGIDAGCEGDVPSILALAWLRALSGEAAWMANPASIDAESGEILLAHCTVPRSGLEGYGIRTHFESGLGVAVAGTLPPGVVTLARIGGRDLRQTWLAEAEIVDSPRREGLCRTQIVARAKPERLRELLEAPLGNHLVIARGSWSADAREYLTLTGIEAAAPRSDRLEAVT